MWDFAKNVQNLRKIISWVAFQRQPDFRPQMRKGDKKEHFILLAFIAVCELISLQNNCATK